MRSPSSSIFSMLYVVNVVVIGFCSVTLDKPVRDLFKSDRCLLSSASFLCLSYPLGNALMVTRILYTLTRL